MLGEGRPKKVPAVKPSQLSCGNCPREKRTERNGGGQMSITKSDFADAAAVAETQGEGEIREFVRRDVATLRRSPESNSEMVANNLSSLLQRVAGTSVREIDNLIGELQTLRDLLQSQGARVQREIVEYASLSQEATQSTRIIAESLSYLKKVPDAPSMRQE